MMVDLYIRHSWRDPRLAHVGDRKLLVSADEMDLIWKPDIFFRGAWDMKVFRDPVPNFLMKLNPDGDVWYTYK